MSFEDIHFRRIPDGVVCSIILIWLVSIPACAAAGGGILAAINNASEPAFGKIATYICSAILRRLVVAGVATGLMLAIAIATEIMLKKKTLGGGDIKLIFALALYLGFWRSAEVLAVACALAIVYMAAEKRRGRPLRGAIPFGPAIAVAGAAWLLVASGGMLHLTERL